MKNSAKIISLNAMLVLAKKFQDEGKKVVLSHGCFDLLHIGHIRYLEAARSYGDVLFVTVTPDRFVDKGPQRPAFSEDLRAEALSALGVVHAVAVNEWPTAVELLQQMHPDIYVKGSDFRTAQADATGKLQREADVCKDCHIELRFTDDIVFSSSNLINRFFSGFSEDIRSYLAFFRERNPLKDIVHVLDKMKDVRVLVIGDIIIDDYCYCTTLGSAAKHPTIVAQQQSMDSFPGGAVAVARHLDGLGAKVTLLSVAGSDNSDRNWIESQIEPSIDAVFLEAQGPLTMRKLRYFDSKTLTKLLEIYNTDEVCLPEENRDSFMELAKKLCQENDLLIMSDFGHGCIFQELRDMVCHLNIFLAVNTQCNAGNRMMHTISQYSKCSYASITEDELRRDVHDRHTHLKLLAPRAAKMLGASLFMATRGKQGSCIANGDGAFIESPALTVKTTDTVGAGDALFAASSLAAYLGAPAELVAFLGNAAGALAVQTMGNSQPLTRKALEKFVTALAK